MDRQAAGTSVYIILRVVDSLKTILAPILPHTAQKLHEYLGYAGQPLGTQHVVEYEEETRSHRALTYDHSGAVGTHSLRSVHAWAPSALPAPLFRKLDESVVEEEYARLEAWPARAALNSESRGLCPGSFDLDGQPLWTGLSVRSFA